MSFYCEDCNKYYRTETILNNHKKTKLHARKGKSLTKERLDARRERVASREQKKDNILYCEKCKKHFKSRSSMKGHLISDRHINKPEYDGTYLEYMNSEERKNKLRANKLEKRKKEKEAYKILKSEGRLEELKIEPIRNKIEFSEKVQEKNEHERKQNESTSIEPSRQ